jgi:hypothetical protein
MVRPLDVQQVILQSGAVERVQQVQQHQDDVQQRHFQAKLSEEKRELREKIKDLDESDRLTIGEEYEKERHKKPRGEHRKKEESTDDDVEHEGKIDIRV